MHPARQRQYLLNRHSVLRKNLVRCRIHQARNKHRPPSLDQTPHLVVSVAAVHEVELRPAYLQAQSDKDPAVEDYHPVAHSPGTFRIIWHHSHTPCRPTHHPCLKSLPLVPPSRGNINPLPMLRWRMIRRTAKPRRISRRRPRSGIRRNE